MNEENSNAQFVVCIDNRENEMSLEFGKIYNVIPDAEIDGMMRIIDDSGEDYGFAALSIAAASV